jgi:Arc/MetJ-type ribon-helix-helix transcriptional regulator
MTNDAERVSDIVARLRHPRHIPQKEYGTASAFVMETVGQMRRERAEAADIIEAQSKALAEAREALKPFAEFVPDFFDDGHQDDDIVSITSHHGGLDLTLTVDDFRRAHALTTPTPENPNG